MSLSAVTSSKPFCVHLKNTNASAVQAFDKAKMASVVLQFWSINLSYNAANLGTVFAPDAVMTVTDGKETKVRNGIDEIKAACQATFNQMKAFKAYFNIVSASPNDGGQVMAEYNMMVGDAMLGNMKDTYTLEEDASGQYLIKNMLSVQTNASAEEVVVTKRRRHV